MTQYGAGKSHPRDPRPWMAGKREKDNRHRFDRRERGPRQVDEQMGAAPRSRRARRV
jgi:hypothetical protein